VAAVGPDFLSGLKREELSVPSLSDSRIEDRPHDVLRLLGVERRPRVALRHDLRVVVTGARRCEVHAIGFEYPPRFGDGDLGIVEVVEAPQVRHLVE
jgi:predicted GTPase